MNEMNRLADLEETVTKSTLLRRPSRRRLRPSSSSSKSNKNSATLTRPSGTAVVTSASRYGNSTKDYKVVCYYTNW